MADALTKVNCSLVDCVFYEPNSHAALCKHPDVLLHKTDKRCPLYRMNWAKKMEDVSKFAKYRNGGDNQ